MPGPFPSPRGYRWQWLGRDALAGATVWAVLVPEALAYATIAGVSPVVGLYAAPAALILYAVFGSSRHLVVGPMAATAALSAAIVGDAADGSGAHFAALTAALAVTVGLAALLAGLLRLGFLASFISEPVLKGFIVGLALTVIAGQLPKLFGVEGGPGDFFEKIWALIGDLGATSGLTVLVGAGSLLLILALRWIAPVVPGPLIAVALGIAVATAFDLEGHGVAVVGDVDTGLPSFGFPDVSLDDLGGLAAGSVGVLLVAFAEGLGAAKNYAVRGHYEVDANRELIGLGAAGLGAGLFIGIGASLLLLLYRSSRTVVSELGQLPGNGHFTALDRHRDSRRIPGVVVLRVEGGIYFANAERIRSTVGRAADRDGVTAVVIDAETVPFIDVSAVRMLDQLAGELEARGVRLLLARDVGQVRDVLRTADAGAELRHIHPTVREAVEAARTGT
ncbi:SulP family inorganic anion transporter [Streptomyces sp. NPDC051740]|uniref:SulP family inorganic anion transporter n=1 Tax=Streptomyces sp. NPDC051740 TaxID=3365673 RepID=UPI00379997F7